MAKNEEPVDPTVYLDKAPTALQERFGEWIQEYVGYDPAKAKTKQEAFLEGVRIATATRMVFQASDFNRAANAEAKAAREAEEPAPAPVKKAAPAKAAKAAPAKAAPVRRRKAAAEPAAEVDEPAQEETAPAAPKARRSPARRVAAATAEAPF